MVSLNVPCPLFGPPPTYGGARPPYVGVPKHMFTAAGPTTHGLTVHNGNLDCEKKGRRPLQTLELNNDHALKTQDKQRMRDLMPGYSSIDYAYGDLGWKKHPVSGLPVPPEVEWRQTPSEESVASRRPRITKENLKASFSDPGLRRPSSASTIASSRARLMWEALSQAELKQGCDTLRMPLEQTRGRPSSSSNSDVASKADFTRRRAAAILARTRAEEAAAFNRPWDAAGGARLPSKICIDAPLPPEELEALALAVSSPEVVDRLRRRPHSAPAGDAPSEISSSVSGSSSSGSRGRARSAVPARAAPLWPFTAPAPDGAGAQHAKEDRLLARRLKARMKQPLVFC